MSVTCFSQAFFYTVKCKASHLRYRCVYLGFCIIVGPRPIVSSALPVPLPGAAAAPPLLRQASEGCLLPLSGGGSDIARRLAHQRGRKLRLVYLLRYRGKSRSRGTSLATAASAAAPVVAAALRTALSAALRRPLSPQVALRCVCVVAQSLRSASEHVAGLGAAEDRAGDEASRCGRRVQGLLRQRVTLPRHSSRCASAQRVRLMETAVSCLAFATL